MDIYEKIKFCIEHRPEVPDEFKESTKLLDKWMLSKDKEGIHPEIFITSSNRTGGKTYYIARLLVDLFTRFGSQFILLTRAGTQLGRVADGVLSAVMEEFEDYTFKETVVVNNVYSEISFRHKVVDEETGSEEEIEEVAGFVLSINASDKIKVFSSAFYDVELMFMDEFQGETYLSRECEKWYNIHMSVARGHGKATRCVPVIMASNSLSIINPYYKFLGLQDKIQDDTKMYRGVGLCLLRFKNEEVANAQKKSRFNIACGESEMAKSNIDNEWLLDSRSCVCKADKSWGRNFYVCTLTCKDEVFAIRKYENGIYYVNRSADWTNNNIYALSVDGVENIECAKRTIPLTVISREFLKGRVRFSDLSCKATMLEWI